MNDPVRYAISLSYAGRTEEAAEVLRKYVRRHPGEAPAWKWLAHTTSDPREALQAVQHVLRIDRTDSWARSAWPVLKQRVMRLAPARRRSGGVLLQALSVLIVAGLASFVWYAAGRPTISPTVLESIPAVMPEVLSATLPAPAVMPEVLPGTLAALAATTEPLPTPLATVEGAPPVDVTTSVEYYTFEGSNTTDVQEALYTQGPLREGLNEHSIAITNYRMWVTWEMGQSLTTCTIEEAVVHLDLTYTYPRWIPEGAPTAALVDEWNRFIEHVVAHEEHHGAIARQCAEDLAVTLTTYDPGASCSDAQAALDTLINDHYAACETRQQAFDDAEGRTTFPLP